MDPNIIARLAAYAEDVAQLEWRLADVIAERDTYQLLTRAALDRLHSTTIALDRTRTQLRRLTEHIRNSTSKAVPARTFTRRPGADPRRYRSVYRHGETRSLNTGSEARP